MKYFDIKPPHTFYWTACDWHMHKLLKRLQSENRLSSICEHRAYLIVPNWKKPSRSYLLVERLS